MAEENPKQQPQQRVISLQSISQEFLGALQRNYDMLAFNLAATGNVTAEQYEQVGALTHAMPVHQIHASFENIKNFAHGLILRQTLNDALAITAACMDQCHLLCNLIKNKPAAEKDPQAVHQTIGKEQDAFARSPLTEKFELFEKRYGITNSLEDAVVSLGIGFGTLLRHKGVVSAEDVDENGELVFEFKTVQISAPAKEGESPEARLVDTRRPFKVGDQIDLSNSEMLSIYVTLTDFFHRLFKAVDEYGMKMIAEQKKNDNPSPSDQ
ncbi:MAG: hypothetical protein K6B46_02520 [Opitutales bacterium]|nr:hypothetical protein [Opitutales bacterium]